MDEQQSTWLLIPFSMPPSTPSIPSTNSQSPERESNVQGRSSLMNGYRKNKLKKKSRKKQNNKKKGEEASLSEQAGAKKKMLKRKRRKMKKFSVTAEEI